MGLPHSLDLGAQTVQPDAVDRPAAGQVRTTVVVGPGHPAHCALGISALKVACVLGHPAGRMAIAPQMGKAVCSALQRVQA